MIKLFLEIELPKADLAKIQKWLDRLKLPKNWVIDCWDYEYIQDNWF